MHSENTRETFEKGNLYRYGEICVLDLEGTFLEMGRQYGRLMAGRMQELYDQAINDYFMDQKGLSRETMLQAARGLFDFYPQRFRDIIRGMSETSGMSLEEHILLNGLELYGPMAGCSAIFAWDKHADQGRLIAGRNYDWFDSYSDFAKQLTVTVFRPVSGIPACIITFAGVIYVSTGMNSKGLFIELNNGLPSGGGLFHTNRVHPIVNLMAFLFDYEYMEQLDAAMHTTRSNFAFIINAADEKSAVSYEWPPFDLRRRLADEPGLLVSTNHFVHPSWDLAPQDNNEFKSRIRRKNLLDLGRRATGPIDAQTMMDILDTPMDKGGATWPDKGNIRTIYQIMVIPRDRSIWVKIPGYQDWTAINLQRFFQGVRTEQPLP